MSRRQEILDVAARLFADRGFHGVGVDDIGASVGISGPGLYRHFASKDAMLAEMLVGISERLLTEGRTRVAAAPDARAALDALVRWHIDFALENPALITVQDRDLASVPEPDRRRVRRLQREYVEVWVQTLAETRPGQPREELRASAHAVFGLINSTPHSVGHGGPDGPTMAALLRRMALAALLAPAGPEAAGGSSGAGQLPAELGDEPVGRVQRRRGAEDGEVRPHKHR